jgi:excinuclease UvrABC ATPase subunit
MDQEIIVDAIKHNTAQQSRIADALEEILRLVKKDLEAADAYRRQQND